MGDIDDRDVAWAAEFAPEVDRVALCVHRPSAQHPEFRGMVERLGIPPGSIVVTAARHLVAGVVTRRDVGLLIRYAPPETIDAIVERHVAKGWLVPRGDGLAASPEFAEAAREILRLQADVAASLWAESAADLDDLASRAADIVSCALAAREDLPAFRAQVATHTSLPASIAGQLLGSITELRYLRSDVHAAVLGLHDLHGEDATALHRLWKGHPAGPESLARLASRGLATSDSGDWTLTRAGRAVRGDAEHETNRRTAALLSEVALGDRQAFLHALRALPGDDPRPIEDR